MPIGRFTDVLDCGSIPYVRYNDLTFLDMYFNIIFFIYIVTFVFFYNFLLLH